jgi:hypothetical protein
MNYTESYESEWLKALINNKKQYFPKASPTSLKPLQAEIMGLENNILPLIQLGSCLYHSEVAKHVVKCYDAAVNLNCNYLVTLIPIKAHYDYFPKVGLSNPYQFAPIGTPQAMQVHINGLQFCNFDGNTGEPCNVIIEMINF